MKTIKFLAMMIAMLAMNIGFSSCSNDDDEPLSAYQDYYIECSAKGGGFDAAELKALESELNVSLSSVTDNLEAIDQDTAIYIFDKFVKGLRDEFSSGEEYIEGTLKLTLTLKTVNGKKVKSSTLNITSSGCTIS